MARAHEERHACHLLWSPCSPVALLHVGLQGQDVAAGGQAGPAAQVPLLGV